MKTTKKYHITEHDVDRTPHHHTGKHLHTLHGKHHNGHDHQYAEGPKAVMPEHNLKTDWSEKTDGTY